MRDIRVACWEDKPALTYNRLGGDGSETVEIKHLIIGPTRNYDINNVTLKIGAESVIISGPDLQRAISEMLIKCRA